MDAPPAWTPEDLARRTGVSLRTARRWRQTGRQPAWAAILIRVLYKGDLGAIDPAWGGWSLRDGKLASFENWSNWTFTPGDVLAIPLARAQISSYQTKLKYSAQADWVDQRWREPDETRGPDQRTVAAMPLARK